MRPAARDLRAGSHDHETRDDSERAHHRTSSTGKRNLPLPSYNIRYAHFARGPMPERVLAGFVAAVRSLFTAPLSAAAAVGTLAVAVVLNLAMTGLIDRALLSPPAHIVDPGSVVTLTFHANGNDAGLVTTTSYVTFRALRADVAGFADTAAWQPSSDRVIVNGEQLPAEIAV